MRMSEKCRNNNNSDNPLTSHRTDRGKNRMGAGCMRGLNNPFSAPGADNVHRRFDLESPSLLLREEAP